MTRGGHQRAGLNPLIMSGSESAHGPRRSQRERKQVHHFTSGPSLPRSFPYILSPDVQICSSQAPLRRGSTTGLTLEMTKMNTWKDASPMRMMSHPRMKTSRVIMACKDLGANLAPHPRRRANRKRPNALASRRLAMPGTPPLASQKRLKLMATRQTRIKSRKTSKSTATTRFSVRVDPTSPSRVSHPSGCYRCYHEPVSCPSVYGRGLSRLAQGNPWAGSSRACQLYPPRLRL